MQPIGTGRLAIPLTQRGISVTGIELSAAMADQLAKKHAGIPVVLGDMATTTLPATWRQVGAS